MPRPLKPHLRMVFLLTLLFSVGTLVLSRDARSQEDSVSAAKKVQNYSSLTVKPGSLSFKRLEPSTGPAFETADFTVFNSGKGTTALNATVNNPTGKNAAAFSIVSGGGTLNLPVGASQTVTVKFQPQTDGTSTAQIVVSSDASKGGKTHTLHLSGSAKGPIPSASPTTTPTATPSATPTPASVATDKNSASAPGVTISGDTVTVYVPLGSDVNNTQGAVQVVVEGASPLPTPALIATDRVNSCTPASSGEVVCSGQGGTVDLIPAGGGTPTIQPLSNATIPNVNYAAGDCMGCGALVDNLLSPSLAIVSSGIGFIPVDLANGTVLSPIATNGTNPDEAVGEVFGYDIAHHLILSANYTVNPSNGFSQTPPHFQIINVSNPASPVIYELANDQTVFLNNGRTCSGTNNDKLPDVTALDTSTDIAYVTFHTPSACFNAPPDDIAMFDLSQATFTPGTAGAPNTWTTPSIVFQSISGTAINGIDPISVEATHHLALVNADDNNFGVLQLPSASGAGTTLSIPDWVNAEMPNDPNGVVWAGWRQPSGLATYVSPTTGKVMGVLMNNPSTNGQFTGPTFLAIVDLDDLLNPAVTLRNSSEPHEVDPSVDLVTSGIVRFVPVQ